MAEATLYTLLILCSVGMMFAAVMAKVLAATRVHSLKRRNAVADLDLQQLGERLKVARQQKAVVKDKEAKLTRQKSRLTKKIAKIQDGLMEYKMDHANRQQMRDHMRGKLIRPNPEGGSD